MNDSIARNVIHLIESNNIARKEYEHFIKMVYHHYKERAVFRNARNGGVEGMWRSLNASSLGFRRRRNPNGRAVFRNARNALKWIDCRATTTQHDYTK